jgi:hypothetical protein
VLPKSRLKRFCRQEKLYAKNPPQRHGWLRKSPRWTKSHIRFDWGEPSLIIEFKKVKNLDWPKGSSIMKLLVPSRA